ncbi:MAG: hypothetical protein J0H66_11625 [Solirubrobacterales bacterium]|nr:hypothetical protein [Solirubrobacterales bacterium]OJU94782.1 MAG: hypothetical protein BGO23_07970 [Solirubrobacterales bacterium 67-14]
MTSSRTRLIVAGAITLIVVVALFVILKPDDNDDDNGPTASGGEVARQTEEAEKDKAAGKPAPKPVIPTVVVKDGEPRGGILKIDATKGDQIAFKVRSDVDEEIHVHGYDISKDISAGESATIKFKADIDGIFEVELENSAIPIVELQINP